MMFVDVLTHYIVPILSIGVTATSVVFSVLKTKKQFNASGTIILLSKIPTLVQEAEKMFPKINGNKTGLSKFNYVMSQLKIYALENKFKLDTELLSDTITDIVESSKVINKNPIEEDISKDSDNSVIGDDVENISNSNKEVIVC